MIERRLRIESEAPAQSIHLLDDDSDWLQLLFEYLSYAGYRVMAAASIDDAFGLVARGHPDVFIADRDIPVLSEIELLDQVGSLSPATRVILTTERSAAIESLGWLRLVGVDILVKPIDWNILRRAVERAVQPDRSRHLVD